MVFVDSSVLISWFRSQQTPQIEQLIQAANNEAVLLGDLVVMEVLQGARSERDAITLLRRMREFEIESVVHTGIAEEAARNFRILRGLGITMRRQVDLLIGTFCIVHGHELLHADRDFEAMERHLGLRVAGGPEPVH